MKELPQYLNTAGKITIVTALLGVFVFAVIFLLNIGANQLHQVEAQGLATTTVTVLNTPPVWTIDAQELVESSTAYPTNAGSQVKWVATATDSNNDSYYLLLCSSSTTAPTAHAGAAPTCGSGVEWAVSGLTTSGTQAQAATTTKDSFAENNPWFAYVCDSVAVNPRCNATYKQGSGTTSSPFVVNHRPVFTAFTNDSPKLPGQTVTFTTTSSDPDTGSSVKLIVCSTNSFNTASSTCNGMTIATSTLQSTNAAISYAIKIPTQDQTYGAYGFVVDNHDFAATGGSQGADSDLIVANATPTVSAALITLNDGSDLTLTNEATQTPGFTLQYTATDNNSCLNASSGNEIKGYLLSIFRSGVGSTTCNGSAGSYNPNNCYPSGINTSTWALSCTASTTSCSGATDTTEVYNCTFPLWYVADPTDAGSLYSGQTWNAAVSAIDDNGATSTFTESSTGQPLESFMSIALDTLAIPYGSLEPGHQTDPLTASTTIRATGNVGINELLQGQSMCTTYTTSSKCPNSLTSTIPASDQVYATSSVSYGTATSSGNTLASTTQKLFKINVPKSTATSTQAAKATYWGIKIPGTITLSGAYTGENTFYGAASDPSKW